MDKNNQWVLGLVTGVVITSLIAIGLNKMQPKPVSQIQEPIVNILPRDIIEAYNMGLKDALRLNPVSLELDQACLTLWANKQPLELK